MNYLNLYYIWSMFLFLFSISFFSMGMFFYTYSYSVFLEWNLLTLNSLNLSYVILLDWISMFFSFVVFFISSMVVLYSSVYMGTYNYSSIRFLFLVLLFVGSMLLMILSPSLVSILLGWDGLGLVSYCLVIYYSSMKSYLAGLITCLINRLGDIGLLISIAWVFSYGSWNFTFYLSYYLDSIYYLIILSSFTKSAQIPFSSWLPAAMAAPTPVSSLVHSSTLVTAGVYLLIRFHNSMIFSNNYFLFISMMTMIMSSMCANYEFDLKKIIALSTLSQLGLMMSSLFMGLVDLAFFHLLTHAMFKSLLFLCSGIIIHLMSGCQDIRSMGSICLSMPLTCSCFNISNLALCGIPFLSGFYSKDLIIEFSEFSGMSLMIFMMFFVSLSLTSFYSMRLFFYSILNRYSFQGFSSLFDSISYMKYSVIMLSLVSVMFGSLFMWISNMDLMFLMFPVYLSMLTLLMVVMGFLLSYEMLYLSNFFGLKYYFLNGSMWFMYSYSFPMFLNSYFYSLNLMLVMSWGEFFGGMGLTYYFIKLSNYSQFYTLNNLSIFFMVLIVWLIVLI
uniref:NADH-ubiquinone oxidoreductase chain 5 n=1 Tax=Cicadula sp. EMHAU-2015-Zz052713 TaxID=2038642 RepID=A0A343K5Z4_9HEMI|nr:NADH dehydrogenase subunit 5 [Cicadula sp. EMHAU-2015-Zz052713]